MGRMEVIEDDEMGMVEDIDYGDEVLDGPDEGEEEQDDKEEEAGATSSEDRDNMSLLELFTDSVTTNFAFRAAQKGTKKLLSSAKTVTAVGLKGAWIVLSTAIIIGVPVENDCNVKKMQPQPIYVGEWDM